MVEARIKSAIGSLLILILGIAGYSSLVLGQEDIGSGGIGGRPAFPREENSRTESIFIHTLNPGDSVDDGINVINNSADTRTIRVYATDSLVSSGGAFACEQQVEETDDVGGWIQLAKSEVTLESAGSEIVPFSVTVPANTDVGEHGGCLVVQEVREDSTPEAGIGLSFRTAIRLAVLVPGDIQKSLEIVDLSVRVNDEKMVATTNVQNNGNVSIDAEINTEVSYFFGLFYSESGGRFPVLRGETGEWNFDHERPFWGGWYKTIVSAEYDPNPDNFLGDAPSETETLTYPGVWVFIWPKPLALVIEILVLLLLVGAITSIIRRIRLAVDGRRHWKKRKVLKGEDIRKVAKTHRVRWRRLAQTTGITADSISCPTVEVNMTA